MVGENDAILGPPVTSIDSVDENPDCGLDMNVEEIVTKMDDVVDTDNAAGIKFETACTEAFSEPQVNILAGLKCERIFGISPENLDVMCCRSMSPELFDGEELNSEKVSAAFIALGADQNSIKYEDVVCQPAKPQNTVGQKCKEMAHMALPSTDTCPATVNGSGNCQVDDPMPVMRNKNTSLAQKLLNQKNAHEKQKVNFGSSPTKVVLVGQSVMNPCRDSTAESIVGRNRIGGEDESVVRKSTRMKRKSLKVREANGRQRGLGVDFLDEIDGASVGERAQPSLNCPTCSRLLLADDSVAVNNLITRETYQPAFWKLLTGAKFKRANHQFAAVTINIDHLCCKALTLQGPIVAASLPPGIVLNSYWSDDDGCCIRPVYCLSCQDNDSVCTWLGVEVKAMTPEHCPRIQLGQVWLVPQCLVES
jgi:hypothetical protein